MIAKLRSSTALPTLPQSVLWQCLSGPEIVSMSEIWNPIVQQGSDLRTGYVTYDFAGRVTTEEIWQDADTGAMSDRMSPMARKAMRDGQWKWQPAGEKT